MTHPPDVDSGVTTRGDLDNRLDEYRTMLIENLDGISDDDARAIIISGRPSLLGVVRHTAFVEGVWFDEAVTGRSRKAIGIPTSTANSWKVRKTDTVESVIKHHQRITDASRKNLADLDLTDVVTGRGPRTVLSLLTHVLSEIAWNTGQTDILRAALQHKRE